MGLRVLIIEDHDDFADFLLRGLREEGFIVNRAKDVEDGWHALSTGESDVILLDRGLNGEDGLTLLKRLRASGRATPVLMLTARDAIPDRVAGLDAGADDYLPKPFSFDELLARIRALARRQPATDAAILGYADVRINLATQRVERNSHKLDLTAKEYSLLVYFVRNAGQVLSRTRIYENVWEEQYDGLSNTLEVHVKDLRRKLELHGPRLVQTLRNRGYRFSTEGETP